MLKLYTTSHCHLCETALALVLQQCDADKLELVEIAQDTLLINSYGLRIPVLQRLDTLAELNWPFTEYELHSFLSK
jgi:hypothetical protein